MKVLIPVDQSDAARRAIAHTARLAQDVGSIDVILLNVRNGPELRGELSPLDYQSLDRAQSEAQQRLLADALEHAKRVGLTRVHRCGTGTARRRDRACGAGEGGRPDRDGHAWPQRDGAFPSGLRGAARAASRADAGDSGQVRVSWMSRRPWVHRCRVWSTRWPNELVLSAPGRSAPAHPRADAALRALHRSRAAYGRRSCGHAAIRTTASTTNRRAAACRPTTRRA